MSFKNKLFIFLIIATVPIIIFTCSNSKDNSEAVQETTELETTAPYKIGKQNNKYIFNSNTKIGIAYENTSLNKYDTFSVVLDCNNTAFATAGYYQLKYVFPTLKLFDEYSIVINYKCDNTDWTFFEKIGSIETSCMLFSENKQFYYNDNAMTIFKSHCENAEKDNENQKFMDWLFDILKKY